MPVFESSRKIQLFGSSLALTLPSMFVKVNEVEKGSTMKVYYGLDGVLVASDSKDLESLRKNLYEIVDKLEEKVQNSKKVDWDVRKV